jgi:hypothetical protein
MNKWITEQTDANVLSVRYSINAGWQQDNLLISDVHFDSPHCRKDILRRLLNQAKERNAGIGIIGDWFDVMQGRDDRRSAKSDLAKQYKVSNYFDAVVEDSAAFLEPYKENILFASEGNHETAITKHHETNLLKRLCEELDVPHMGYSGFIRWMFHTENEQGQRSNKSSVPMYFHHGWGGGGEVNKGVARAQRERGPIPDAQIYVGGHTHTAYAIPDMRVRLSPSGRIANEMTLHINLPTLKDEYNMREGFHVEKGRWPRVLGGYWLRFWYSADSVTRVKFGAELAV